MGFYLNTQSQFLGMSSLKGISELSQFVLLQKKKEETEFWLSNATSCNLSKNMDCIITSLQ